MRKQTEADNVQRAEQRRRDTGAVMQRAAELFGQGKLAAIDIARLHALRMRLDGGLLPEGRN